MKCICLEHRVSEDFEIIPLKNVSHIKIIRDFFDKSHEKFYDKWIVYLLDGGEEIKVEVDRESSDQLIKLLAI